jgi:type II secretory pathway pseudopilin PulG
MKRQNRQKSPRGYLMLDMIIVMTMTIMLLSVASIWVYKTLQYSTDIKQRELHARSISRISRQLRTDVRNANSMVAKDKSLIIESDEKQSIEYSINANTVHREASGAPVHHDDFEFATNATLTWSVDANSGAVSLDVGRDFSDRSASKKEKRKGLDAQILLIVAEEPQ